MAVGSPSDPKGAALISPRRGTLGLSVERLEPGARGNKRDHVAIEEPLEIRVEFGPAESRLSRNVAVTMRTPGHDFELAAGFLFSEGILNHRRDVREITYCQSEGPQEYNVLSVRLRPGVPFDPTSLERNFYTSSSCGVCGKASIESVEVKGCKPLVLGDLRLDAALIDSLPDQLRSSQSLFDRTGGLHAAGVFDGDGALEWIREDVGRHNAVDKVIGAGFLDGGASFSERVLVVSGRTSFEILQKAVSAGFPVIVAVGAPSSLAVDVAREFNVTLVGFARGGSFNVYTAPARVLDWEPELS